MHSREPVPVACTLDLQSMGGRLSEIQRLTREHLRAHRVEGSTLRLTYGAEAAPEVERIVGLERVCCAFLDFDIKTSLDAVELSIAAPRHAVNDAQWLFAHFLPAMPLPDAPAPKLSECPCCRG
jgi:hypothetical protein